MIPQRAYAEKGGGDNFMSERWFSICRAHGMRHTYHPPSFGELLSEVFAKHYLIEQYRSIRGLQE